MIGISKVCVLSKDLQISVCVLSKRVGNQVCVLSKRSKENILCYQGDTGFFSRWYIFNVLYN